MQAKKLRNLPLYLRLTGKKANGIVYTPRWIVELILDSVAYTHGIYDKKIIDPSCGEGAFLMVVLERFLIDCMKHNLSSDEIKVALSNNIFGFDIDKEAIERCKINLRNIAMQYGIEGVQWNIHQLDSLDRSKVEKYFKSFDYVVGNPPYIRIQHLGKDRREKLQREWSFCQTGSTDGYIAFFELGINLLSQNGRLGYITPNTYFKTKAAYKLRRYLIGNRLLERIIDFNDYQVFSDATTYSAITILSKNNNKTTVQFLKGYKESTQYVDDIDFSNFYRDRWILASNKTLRKIREIEERGMPLGKIARIHVGITTLADGLYIFKEPIIEGDRAIIKLSDGRSFSIETKILKPIVKVSTLKSPEENQNRYIIFPYKRVNGKYVIIPEEELADLYPNTYRYFLEVKDRLLLRDKKKPNPVSWYAFGRSQGLETTWGKKILVPPIGRKPNFIVWEKEEYTFYAGYCIKFDGDLHWLAGQLNSEDMEFYINHVSRDYQNGYKSYAKSFIARFGVPFPLLFYA